MKRRFLPILLVLALCLGMLPTSALAAEIDTGAFSIKDNGSSSTRSIVPHFEGNGNQKPGEKPKSLSLEKRLTGEGKSIKM